MFFIYWTWSKVIAAQNDFEPIRIETHGVKFDKGNAILFWKVSTVTWLNNETSFILDLIEEYEDKVGDMDIVCQGGEKLRCHSCVISCQSNVMRRSLRRGLDDSQLNCPKFTHATMSKLLQIMYCSDASFEYANEMIEVSVKAQNGFRKKLKPTFRSYSQLPTTISHGSLQPFKNQQLVIVLVRTTM